MSAALEIPAAQIADLCRRYHVRELGLFGSAARGELRDDSDIDILVEFLPNSGMNLFRYADMEDELSQMFGRKVDLVSKNGLKPRVRDYVFRDLQILYAA
ncbi:MAG: nucleotidyltransferase family protein [Bryobacteraceae bacterium]|nr:nucleotidyltransferase family protein [Solibacteraceae bacterium]MCO5349322.1 nucleotidyltransferase family protein [Bryobacteraceae bacterium]